MNVVCLTQAGSLEPLYRLVRALAGPLRLGRVGFHVADAAYYEGFLRREPGFAPAGYVVTKEWEILERARRGAPDRARLAEIEARLGDPTLWGALVADRRVCLGPDATFRQDYRARFSHDQMLRILEEGAAALEALFDAVRPDFVVSFICVTFGDYLGYLLARARGVPFLNLRSARIRNYVHFGESVFEPSARVRRAYEEHRARPRRDEPRRLAAEYLAEVREGDARYEGVLRDDDRPALPPALLRRTVSLGRAILRHYLKPGDRDNHAPHPVRIRWHSRVTKPLWRRRLLSLVARSGLPFDTLRREGYVLFPLHTEPEVTLLVHSRTCVNQIEVVRTLSRALPVGMRVVVKEHPAAVGKRPLGYYRKLLAIPGVVLADPRQPSRPLIEGARLVATIAGSIGLEALVRGKPVLLFGHAPYEILPDTMVRRVADLEETARAARELLAAPRPDEEALTAYVAAVIQESAPVDLYSRLLRRADAYTLGPETGPDDEARYDREVQALAAYTVESLRRMGVTVGAPAESLALGTRAGRG